VCEVDAKGDLSEAYECGPLEFRARPVGENLFAMRMETEASLREYLRLHLHLPLVARIGPLARSLDYVATAAPGVREILTVGKVAFDVRENVYDLVIVDGPATGHVVGLFAAPRGIRRLVQVGPVRTQTQWMLDILEDPVRTGVVVVATPEEMPVVETLELIGRLDAETGVDLAAVVVNRVLPELFGGREEAIFDRIREPVSALRLREQLGGSVEPVLDAAALAVDLRRARAGHVGTLRRELAGRAPMLYVPYLFGRRQGLRALARVSEALEAELT
jgi:anion-transporting  ArsA/GET3 family ATPase